MNKAMKSMAVALIATGLCGAAQIPDTFDANKFPYGLIGMQGFVENKRLGIVHATDVFAVTYKLRMAGMVMCASKAHDIWLGIDEALQAKITKDSRTYNVADWDFAVKATAPSSFVYVCCTVTQVSDCASKFNLKESNKANR